VIAVSGDLTIQENIIVPNGSTVLFSVKGDIKVNGDVGHTTLSSTTNNLEGFYSTDKNFIVRDDNNDDVDDNRCPTSDRRLNIGGTVITNAALEVGALLLQRDLCGENQNYPTIFFTERLDFILNAPRFLKREVITYKEVPPK
jgi:hypothetical protein